MARYSDSDSDAPVKVKTKKSKKGKKSKKKSGKSKAAKRYSTDSSDLDSLDSSGFSDVSSGSDAPKVSKSKVIKKKSATKTKRKRYSSDSEGESAKNAKRSKQSESMKSPSKKPSKHSLENASDAHESKSAPAIAPQPQLGLEPSESQLFEVAAVKTKEIIQSFHSGTISDDQLMRILSAQAFFSTNFATTPPHYIGDPISDEQEFRRGYMDFIHHRQKFPEKYQQFEPSSRTSHATSSTATSSPRRESTKKKQRDSRSLSPASSVRSRSSSHDRNDPYAAAGAKPSGKHESNNRSEREQDEERHRSSDRDRRSPRLSKNNDSASDRRRERDGSDRDAGDSRSRSSRYYDSRAGGDRSRRREERSRYSRGRESDASRDSSRYRHGREERRSRERSYDRDRRDRNDRRRSSSRGRRGSSHRRDRLDLDRDDQRRKHDRYESDRSDRKRADHSERGESRERSGSRERDTASKDAAPEKAVTVDDNSTPVIDLDAPGASDVKNEPTNDGKAGEPSGDEVVVEEAKHGDSPRKQRSDDEKGHHGSSRHRARDGRGDRRDERDSGRGGAGSERRSRGGGFDDEFDARSYDVSKEAGVSRHESFRDRVKHPPRGGRDASSRGGDERERGLARGGGRHKRDDRRRGSPSSRPTQQRKKLYDEFSDEEMNLDDLLHQGDEEDEAYDAKKVPKGVDVLKMLHLDWETIRADEDVVREASRARTQRTSTGLSGRQYYSKAAVFGRAAHFLETDPAIQRDPQLLETIQRLRLEDPTPSITASRTSPHTESSSDNGVMPSGRRQELLRMHVLKKHPGVLEPKDDGGAEATPPAFDAELFRAACALFNTPDAAAARHGGRSVPTSLVETVRT